MNNQDQLANPFYEILGMANGVPTRYRNHTGLTKREHFAAMAMQGLCSHSGDYHLPEHMAKDAVMYADALLAELEK